MPRPRILLLSGFAAVLLAVGGGVLQAAREKTDYLDKPIPEWREGPIRYIITKSEDNEYRSLSTQEDRARFIEGFWQRRDETPETPGNEFRAEFWKRVRDANRLYSDDVAKPGWRTDMGKIHILRGPPDDITRDLVPQGGRGTVVWTYRNSGTAALGPNVVVAFARDVTGEFRLSTEPSKDSDPRIAGGLAYQPAMGVNAAAKAAALDAAAIAAHAFNLTDPLIRQAGGPAISSPLALVSDLAKLQQPSRQWELTESITTREFFGSVPMRARADFFRTTTSSTLVILTAGIKSSAVHYRRLGTRDVPDVAMYGRVLDLTGNDLVLSLEKDADFAPARENSNVGLDDDLLFQAAALLPPGSYKILLTALDRVGGRAGSYEIPITVPDLNGEGLMLSSVMIARAISNNETTTPEPFVFGALRVVPRLGQTFKPGDDLALYYQIYGATKDPVTGQPSLDVDYGFFTVESEQTKDLGHVSFSDQKNEVHGYALNLKDWPAGPYLLRVSITDRIAQASSTRDIVFEVRP